MFRPALRHHPEDPADEIPVESSIHCHCDGIGESLLSLETIARGPSQQILLENDRAIIALVMIDNRRDSSFDSSIHSCLLRVCLQ